MCDVAIPQAKTLDGQVGPHTQTVRILDLGIAKENTDDASFQALRPLSSVPVRQQLRMRSIVRHMEKNTIRAALGGVEQLRAVPVKCIQDRLGQAYLHSTSDILPIL